VEGKEYPSTAAKGSSITHYSDAELMALTAVTGTYFFNMWLRDISMCYKHRLEIAGRRPPDVSPCLRLQSLQFREICPNLSLITSNNRHYLVCRPSLLNSRLLASLTKLQSAPSLNAENAWTPAYGKIE
jgi:hypothetical protein